MEREHQQGERLHRTLKERHLNMIAIGGAIGTGLFFSCGSAVSQSGPGGALLAFALIGTLVYFLMTSLGEMATFLPLSGSFETYASRFVDPAFGFTLGWNYWLCYAIFTPASLMVASFIIKFWFPQSSTTLTSFVLLVILLALNLLSAKAYGETEFWFAGIKVVAISAFIIVGGLMIFGVIGSEPVGFSNWVLSDGLGNKAPFVGGIMAMMSTFMIAGFSFSGTELVGLAAGESEDPEKNVPKAIKAVFWRILIFYIGAITVIGFLMPFTDPNLLKTGAENIAFSPFTLVFKNAGLTFAANLMNLVIFTSVLSAANSGIYAASRMLYAMGVEGKAPKTFAKVNRRGVPVASLLFTVAIGGLAFLASMIGEGKVYYIFYNASGLTSFLAWLGIAICHYRFRKAYILQGRKLSDLKYVSKFYPFGPIFSMIVCIIVIFGANMWVFQAETFSWFDFITNYAMIPIFPLLYFGYKKYHNTKIVPLMECDFETKELQEDTAAS